MPKVEREERELLYPEPEVSIVEMTVDLAKDALGWEDEPSYTARLLKTHASLKPAQAKLPDGEVVLKNCAGKRVACWNNGKNRPFDESWARRIAQDILNGNWRLNMEAVIVGKTGLILSGQHRLIGFLLAEEMRQTEEHWKHLQEPLVLKTVLALGAEEDQQTVNTLDNTKARTDSDAVYTAGVFDGWTVKEKVGTNLVTRPLDKGEKKECARMLAAATAMLWQRTAAGREFHEYQTHSELSAFREQHPRLLSCVQHLFDRNRDRAISKLTLSAGQCSAACYLMGSAGSNAEAYRGLEPQPGEAVLTWERWDTALQFWTDLTDGDLPGVSDALGKLVDADTLTGGRTVEKLCVLAKAWEAYVGGVKPTEAQLKLRYVENDLKQLVLDERPGFGGIDVGPKRPKVDEPEPIVTPLQQAAEKKLAAAPAPKKPPVPKPAPVPKQAATPRPKAPPVPKKPPTKPRLLQSTT